MTRDQASRLLALPDPGPLKGKRDRAMLGLLLGYGLRPMNSCGLRSRRSNWGRKAPANRPVPRWAKAWIDGWLTAATWKAAASSAPSIRGVMSGDGLTVNIIWSVVQDYAAEIGVPQLAPP